MKSLSEVLTESFYAWEQRGRGWLLFDYPVPLEPPFRPFLGHVLPRVRFDDGRRPHWIARLFGIGRQEPEEEPEEECAPEEAEDYEPLAEFMIDLAPDAAVPGGVTDAWLRALSAIRFPLSFEIVGGSAQVSLRLACRDADRGTLLSQTRAFFPHVLLREGPSLQDSWQAVTENGAAGIVEFGLAREFMLPLRSFSREEPDPLLPLFAALAALGSEEIGLLQVLFEPVRNAWAPSILRSVVFGDGSPFFPDAPEVVAGAKAKAASPLFAVVLRLAAGAQSEGRVWHMIRDLSAGLLPFGSGSANELVPLATDESLDLSEDLLGRQSHRSGMLLSADELRAFVHLPGASVRLPGLFRERERTKAAPEIVRGVGMVLGWNSHEGRRVAVRLPQELRTRHVHVVGGSGTGKSTLLVQMIVADLEAGAGVGVLDPHGDLVEEVLARLPEERAVEAVFFDPADEEPVGWNVLGAASEIEKQLLASDLVGVFRRLSTSWGDVMSTVLGNAVLAFLESEEGGTLMELRQFLVDPDFRRRFLGTIRDEHVLYYWTREFPLLIGKPQGPILTRLDTFLRSKLVRAVVTARENRLNFRELIDRGGIFLGKLAQGALGEENAGLLGSLLVSKFHQVALSRQDLRPEERRPFYLYVDECQYVATPSMAGLLAGTRKYRLGLTLAHQDLHQLKARDPDVLSALLTNAGSRICFRVNEEDARALEKGFSYFSAADLVNLPVGSAICRFDRSEGDCNLETWPLKEVPAELRLRRRERVLSASRARYGSPRKSAEAPQPPEETASPPPSEAPASERAPAAPPQKAKASLPAEPAALGRGGAEHQYLQELVKRLAEAKGYLVTIEQPILEGRGSVDVSIEREGWKLACEISVTSTVEQEVGNVEKCLAAGFDQVVLLSMKTGRLRRVRAALEKRLSEEVLSRVHFLSPEEFSAFLDKAPESHGESMVGGYKVKVKYRRPSGDAEAGAKGVAQVIARSMKRLGNKG
jgi:hypothetical protein